MMRRLWDGERQQEEAEQELQNLMSQVHGHKQEQEEHNDKRQQDDKVYNFSDLKNAKPNK